MIAIIILTVGVSVLVLACVGAYRDAKRREAMDGPLWSIREGCHLCAGRLTTDAHYIGGGRVCCDSCYSLTHEPTT